MGRRKKQEIAGMKLNPTRQETVEAFVGRCFKEGVAMCICPQFGSVYIIDGIQYKFTEEVLEDMLETGMVQEKYRTDKIANLIGKL